MLVFNFRLLTCVIYFTYLHYHTNPQVLEDDLFIIISQNSCAVSGNIKKKHLILNFRFQFLGSHKTKIDDQLDHFGYADAKKEHGSLRFQITVRTYLLRCHLHNIQYSNPNNKILRYDKSQM